MPNFETTSLAYPPEILTAFRKGKAKDVLSKYLYDYREHTEDESFHFLIGLCLYRMGYYEEAHAAFRKAQSVAKPGSHKGEVFDALVLLMAQRDEEAKEAIEKIPLASLNANEIVTLMAVKKALKMPVFEELQTVILKRAFPTEADRRVWSLLAYQYAGFEDAASNVARSLHVELFQDLRTYLYVLKELYKLHMQKTVDSLLKRIPRKVYQYNAEDFEEFLTTCYACGYYDRADEKIRQFLLRTASRRRKGKEAKAWGKAYSRLLCMEYDRLKDEPEKQKPILAEMEKQPHKTEQVLLYLTTDALKNYTNSKQEGIRKNLEALIQYDQTNRKYRKLYCDLLTIMGFLKQADEITKGTIAMRKRLEAEEFALIRSFHSFYMPRPCMMKPMPVHQERDGIFCPVCFGSGYQPIIRAIGAGHTSSAIFTDNLEKRVIEPNEAMLRDLVNWQPMNVPSPIVAKYLLSLGAYISAREYPDVLVPGQTYLYLKLKPESEKRLLDAGYSMLQIDPVSLAMDEKGHADADSGKEVTDIPVSASDFTLEIIHAISPQKDLEKGPGMQEPEHYHYGD